MPVESWGEGGAGAVTTDVREEAGETEVVIDPEAAAEGPGPTRVVLVRHGVTAFTEQHLLDGRGGADPPSPTPAARRPRGRRGRSWPSSARAAPAS